MWKKKSLKNPGGEMELMEHLQELRGCIVRIFIAVCIGATISYEYSTEIFDILSRPYFAAFSNASLIGTGPAEALILKLKVAFFCGIILSGPYIFYQLWLFIAPGLYENEKRMAVPFVASTSVLFLIGAWFCYHYIIPVAFSFFHDQYVSIGLTPTIKVSEHLSMMLQSMVGFGAVFEMPVLAYFLARLGVVNHRMMLSGARYAVVIIFIVSAVLTPPDVLSQMLMAGPLCVLYGLSILIVKYTTPATPTPPAIGTTQ
ncbi:MAG: twin-arginine translocase subunit TatC [Deltaproteobacteria bacterium]|nr:twin-arginine translocase subunit TatC [Deltaproteobacteria bacterium]